MVMDISDKDSIANLTKNFNLAEALENLYTPRGEFSEGDFGRLHGLQSREDLNGEHVRLESWFPPQGRWAVKVTSSGEQIRVKPANLEHAPSASSSADTVSALHAEAPMSASKKKREKAKAAAARKAAVAAGGAAEEESLGPEPAELEWNLHPLDPQQLEGGLARCKAAAQRCAAKHGTWFLYVRKAACWFGEDEEQRRMWFVTLIRHPNLADCYLFQGPTVHDLRAKVGVDAAAACVASLIDNIGTCPERVACAPLGHAGSHRVRSASLLAALLSAGLHGAGLAACAVECSELPEDRASSIVGIALPPRANDRASPARQPRWLCFMSLLEHRIGSMERSINERKGVCMSSSLGGMFSMKSASNVYDNRTASVAALRELFSASAAFHEAEPWHVLSNDEYLHVKSVTSGEEAWVMVCGHNDSRVRGLNVYWSLSDLKHSLPNPMATTREWMDRLQYQTPDMVAFSTLDAIGELDLEVATSRPEVWEGEIIPLWYRKKHAEEGDVDEIVRAWSQPPPHEVWPFLSALMRATARFASSSMAERPHGRHSPLRLSRETVELQGLAVRAFSHDGGRKSFW